MGMYGTLPAYPTYAMLKSLPVLRASTLVLLSTLAACSGSAAPEDANEVDPLTSITARSRQLKFEGVVYVDPRASSAEILAQVRRQTQTAFGALRTASVGVNSRELKEVSPATFKKTKVSVIDGTATPRQMLQVRYTYVDNAVVPAAMARRSTMSLAVMGPDYASQADRILTECTDNDSEAIEFRDSIWYVFNPSLASCRKVMSAEQKAIDSARAKLTSQKTQVVPAEVNRLYLPMTVSLGSDATNKGESFPEYDRLYAGGVAPGKMVVSVVNGLIDHGVGTAWDDAGNLEWMSTLRQVFNARKGFKLVKTDPVVDMSTFTLGSGKKVSGLSFEDFMAWKLDGARKSGLTPEQQTELEGLVGDRLAGKWFTFDADVTVTTGNGQAKNVTLELFTLFGSDNVDGPHKRAIKESDVFLYNGHSYIGFGPLDPNRFTKADFPSSYQILFIDGCVSYNYYEKDYIPLKEGGTKNLDLITNGIEAPAGDSGNALGKFIALLWSGKQASYRDLLSSASSTDSLRSVDGELDNVYSPSVTPIVVSQ